MSEATYVPILPDLSTFFKETSKGAKSAGEQAGRDFAGGMEREVKRAEKAVETAARAQERAANRAADATAKRRLEEQKLAEVMEKGNAKQSDILAATNRLEKARRDEASSIKNAEKASADLASKQSELAKTTDEASNALEVASDKGEGFNISMKDAALGVASFTAAAGGVVAGLVSIGTTFDDAYDTIRIGTGAAGDDFEGLKQSMRNVATEAIGVGSDMGEIGSTLADLNTRLGLTGKPLEDVTAQFMQLQGMGVDADINTVTAALTQFGVEAEETPAAMDTLFQISQATGRSMTDLTSNLSKSGPALQEFGFGLEESAGLLGALDKAGLDSEKTLGSMTRALSDFAKDGKDPQEALWGTIASIDELTAAGKNAEAIDLANSIFGAKGGVGFVAAVESGQFAYDDFLDSIGATDDTIAGLAAQTADFAEHWDKFKLKAMIAVEPVATMLFDQLAPAIERGATAFEDLVGWVTDDLIPAVKQIPDVFRDAGDWIVDNQNKMIAFAAVVSPVVVPIMMAITAQWVRAGVQATISMGKQVAAWVTTRAHAVKSGAVAVKQLWLTGAGWIKAGAQAMVGAARMATAWVVGLGPIGWVIATVAAVGTALWAFFTKTETGQELWGKFTTALSDGWDWVVEKVTAGWDWLKENFFISWDEAVDGIKDSWTYTVDTITGWWDMLTGALSAGWETIKTAVFDAWNTVVGGVKSNWETVTNAVSSAWTWTKDQFVYVWTVVKATVFDAWNTAVETVRSVFSTVTAKLSESWTWLKDNLVTTWTTVKTTVFDAMTSALDTVKGWFSTTVDAIGTTWDKLRSLTAKPVRFVVETVYGGIRNAWNKVAGLVGLGELPEVPLGNLGAYARGGVLPGYTPGRDVHEFYSPTGGRIHLSGGEAIMRPEVTRALGTDRVDALNAAARMGGVPAVQKHLGGFAAGGVIGSISNLVREKFPMMTITSTYRAGDPGHHGAGRAVDFSNGTDTTPQMQAATAWFATNYGKELLELIHSPSPHNIKNGRSVGDGFGFYGAGTMNAHRNHVHVAASAPLAGGGSGGVLGFLEGAVTSVADMAKSAWDSVIDKIPAYNDTGGLFGELPGAFLKKAAGAAWSFIADKASSVGAWFGSPGSGVEQWRPLVEKVLTAKGLSLDLADTTLRRMNQESGGNPRAINDWDINAKNGTPSKGLMQVIDPTFAAHKDPGFNDIWDPESNIRASMNYTLARYGSLPAGYNRAGGYHLGGLAPAGRGFMPKTALEPEMVLNPAMTDAFIQWMKVVPGRESAQVIAKELAVAFRGGDWGYGELASVLGREDWAKAIVNGAARLGEIHRAVDAGVDAANAVWAEQAPGQDDWIQAGWDFLGMGDSLTAGLVRRAGEFDALVADYEADMAEADVDDPDVPRVDDEVTVSEPVTVDAPAIEVPSVADTTSDDSGPVATAGGAGDSGLTVVINLDGVEAVRERIEKVEDGVVEIDKELDALKTERRGLDVAANVLLS